MNTNKVTVENMANHKVSVVLPGTTIIKRWPKKGAKLSFDRDALIEAYYDPGIEYMFTHGVLYTDDMDFKIAVGLEEEGTETPTLMKKMDENYLKRLISLMPISQATEEINALSYDQRQMLVDYAVNHYNDLKMDRIAMLDSLCGSHITKTIELKTQSEE